MGYGSRLPWYMYMPLVASLFLKTGRLYAGEPEDTAADNNANTSQPAGPIQSGRQPLALELIVSGDSAAELEDRHRKLALANLDRVISLAKTVREEGSYKATEYSIRDETLKALPAAGLKDYFDSYKRLFNAIAAADEALDIRRAALDFAAEEALWSIRALRRYNGIEGISFAARKNGETGERLQHYELIIRAAHSKAISSLYGQQVPQQTGIKAA